MSSLLRRFVSSYNSLLQAHPWKVTCLTTAILCGTGDIIAQQIVEKKGINNHEIRRTIKLFGMGLLFIGPTLRTWYFILEKLVSGSFGVVALKKMLIDQACFAPIFISSFFTVSEILEGSNLSQIKNRLQISYLPAMRMNYVIWPAVQMVNFYFVPLSHRVILVNVVALFWNSYLAWAANKGPELTVNQD